ncbi:MAG: hypothetical protein GC149_14410 [Gammaproteobacteria bacterium]|nr:hypothetical protein [Gammaproteobacteria bacterium]
MLSCFILSGCKSGQDSFKDKRHVGGVLACVLGMLFAWLPMTAVTAATPDKTHLHHPREKTLMKRQWGVEVLFVRQTSAGYMLEFRYKVLDAEKARPLFERQTKPLLTHVKTGARLIVPTPAKTGALRNSNPPHAGKTYWMFFANPGKLVKPGDHVNIDIGAFHADELVVQ